MKDPEIRAVLRKTELHKFLSDANSKVVEELRLSPATAQIDIAVINGAFHAYEIKSACDSLNRLANQIDCYTKIFDYITVVTEKKYEKKILQLVQDWVGVSICSENGLQISRKPKRNHNVEGFYIAQLLWRDEIKSLLNECQIKFKSNYRNWLLCELLTTNVAVGQLSELVRKKLKERVNWKDC